MSDMLQIITEGQSTYAPDWGAVAALNAKIAKLMAGVGKLDRDGRNPKFNYTYTSYEEAATSVRSALTAVGLSWTPGLAGEIVTEERSTNSGGVMLTRRVPIEIVLTDIDTGAMRVIRWEGEGQDTQDKATAKAFTSGIKYWMLRSLLTSDQDNVDPDADAAPEPPRQTPRARGTDVTVSLPRPIEMPTPAATLIEEIDQINAWVNDRDMQKRFWTWTSKQGLSHSEVHEALGVDSLLKFAGSERDAAHLVNMFIEAHLAPEQEG